MFFAEDGLTPRIVGERGTPAGTKLTTNTPGAAAATSRDIRVLNAPRFVTMGFPRLYLVDTAATRIWGIRISVSRGRRCEGQLLGGTARRNSTARCRAVRPRLIETVGPRGVDPEASIPDQGQSPQVHAARARHDLRDKVSLDTGILCVDLEGRLARRHRTQVKCSKRRDLRSRRHPPDERAYGRHAQCSNSRPAYRATQVRAANPCRPSPAKPSQAAGRHGGTAAIERGSCIVVLFATSIRPRSRSDFREDRNAVVVYRSTRDTRRAVRRVSNGCARVLRALPDRRALLSG